MWDFPGGPVAKTPRSQGRGPGFSRWSGNQIPHAATKSLHVATKIPPRSNKDPACSNKDPACRNQDPAQPNK